MKNQKLSVEVSETLNGPEVPKVLKKLKKKPVEIPHSDNPVEELRRLVQQHKALTKSRVAVTNMTSDRTNQETGAPILCRLPIDAQAEGQLLAKAYKKSADALKRPMLAELNKIPIYRDYLSKVFVAKGAITAAYLISEIDIHKAVKPSNLRRFCGLAVVNGQLERRTKGAKNAYSTVMRTCLYLLFNTLWKGRRFSPDNKYLAIWDGYRNRIEHSARVSDRGVDKKGDWTGKIELSHPRRTKKGGVLTHVSARGFAFSGGWHKAADVFLEDLYTVWRAMEGLPVWPAYNAAKLGYSHGGKICVNEPRILTLDEALEIVGPDVYGSKDVELEELDDMEEELATAAE